MSVVVSDTSPLHYLILCGAETVLPRLFNQVMIPPTVFRELQQQNTPHLVKDWARLLPPWAAVQAPKALNLSLDVDAGELEAICLAREINAAAVLMNDRKGRSVAIQCGLAVIGTIGLLEQAAAQGLVDFQTRWSGYGRPTPGLTSNSFMPPLDGTKSGRSRTKANAVRPTHPQPSPPLIARTISKSNESALNRVSSIWL